MNGIVHVINTQIRYCIAYLNQETGHRVRRYYCIEQHARDAFNAAKMNERLTGVTLYDVNHTEAV